MRRVWWPVLALTAWASVAHAGNDDEILVGNDAAMAGGAMTAVIDDGSSLYYNPAGLMGIQDPTVDVSGSAYTLRLYDGEGILSGTTGARGGASFDEIVIVPSAVAYVRPISDRLRIGVGVFTLNMSDVVLRTELVSDVGPQAQERLLFTATTKSQFMLGVVGVGWSVTPRLRLGAGLALGYLRSESSFQFGGGIVDTATSEPVGFFSVSQLSIVQGFGARLNAGLQWAPTDALRVGIAVESPAVMLYRSTIADQISSGGSDTGLLFGSEERSDRGFGFEPFRPARVRVGLAYAFGDTGWISLDADVQHGLTNREIDVEREVLVNARVGGELALAPRWSLGAGLFTDRSPDPGPADRVHFYGGTLGVRYRKDRRLDPELEDADALTFETVVALRYAYGSGDTTAIAIDFSSSEVVTETASRFDAHEVGVHVGAGLHF